LVQDHSRKPYAVLHDRHEARGGFGDIFVPRQSHCGDDGSGDHERRGKPIPDLSLPLLVRYRSFHITH
jgi:hypothetical protein